MALTATEANAVLQADLICYRSHVLRGNAVYGAPASLDAEASEHEFPRRASLPLN